MNLADLHFSITLPWFFFPMLYSSVVRRMLGCGAQNRARPAFPSGMAASPTCLIFATSLTLNMANLGSNPKAFQQKLYPRIEAYCLLSSGAQFVRVQFFIFDGNSLA
jgi:hypothetical protein